MTSSDSISEHSAAPLVESLRNAYLNRDSYTLQLAARKGTFFLRKGEIYLDRDDPRGQQLSSMLTQAATQQRPAADPALRAAVEQWVRELVDGKDELLATQVELGGGVELIGPVPTVCLLLDLATLGANEQQLIDRLGGEANKFRSSNATPALQQLPSLDDEMAQVLVLLERPLTVAEVLRSIGDRRRALHGLMRLWAVGLVAAEQEKEERGGVASRRVLKRFDERILESLESEPLALPLEQHRELLASLFGSLGDKNYYEMLGLDPDADEPSIQSAYNDLARRVHPSHTERLGWSGKEQAVLMLFERATEAYLTLSDPLRRSRYNNLMGMHQAVEVGAAQRDEEKKKLARQSYREAATSLAEMDYSVAVELLKEAARMDPRAEYFALLGQAQSKNPRWRRHAAESYHRAIELDPENSGLHLAYGKVLEAEERQDEARAEFQRAVDLMPDNIDAQKGLDRLGGRVSAIGRAGRGGLRSILGRGSKNS